jgi:DNA-binding transcriptional MerR regulator
MENNTETIQTYINKAYNGHYLTIGQAAEKVGRSTRTLKRWKAEGKVEQPTTYTIIGSGFKVNLYTLEDVESLKDYAETTKVGRPYGTGKKV